MATIAELETQLAFIEGITIDRQKQRIAGLELEYADLVKAAQSSNFNLNDPAGLAAFKAARTRAANFEQSDLYVAKLDLDKMELEAQELRNKIAAQKAAEKQQGPGTASAAETVTQNQQVNATGSDTQSPPVPPESVNTTGGIDPINPTTVPSNASPSQTTTPVAPDSPSKLPDGQASNAADNVTPAVGNQGPAPAQQVGGVNLDSPVENNNFVSYIYRAIEVTSNFRQGKFTQDISGAQIFFDLAKLQGTNPDLNRTAPAASAVRNPSAASSSSSQKQGTVLQTATTPGVSNGAAAYAGQVGAEFAAYESTGEIPATLTPPQQERSVAGSTDGTSGSGGVTGSGPGAVGDPTQAVSGQGTAQIPTTATAELKSSPTTTGVAPTPTSAPVIAPQQLASSSLTGSRRELEDQLRLAKTNLATYERQLAQLEQRIQRGEGNPITNRDMRQLYVFNIRKEREIIERLEQQLNAPAAPAPARTNVAPQTGAREY